MTSGGVPALPPDVLSALDRLIAEGGPDAAPGAAVEAMVLAVREAAETARHRLDRIADPALGRLDPADHLASDLVYWGDARVDELIRPWEDDPAPSDEASSRRLLDEVVAVKRSVRLAVFSVDAHIRNVHRRRAAERSRILGEFGRTLAHEIKNRLGAAETALLMLDQMGDADEATRARIYGLVASSLEGAQGSVDDVRGLALYRDPSRFPTTRPESLGEVARRAADGVRFDAEEMGVQIVIDRLPAVRVDGGPARLVLTNLIENGVKYSDRDRAERWVRVRARERDDAVEVVVEDNGVGIPPDFHERVFHRSVRIADDDRGSGLGLAIVRDALQELGGSITLESEPGRGTSITVTFPIRPLGS